MLALVFGTSAETLFIPSTYGEGPIPSVPLYRVPELSVTRECQLDRGLSEKFGKSETLKLFKHLNGELSEGY